jgi:MFS family permease
MSVIAFVATISGAAYAVQPADGIGFSKSIYLWILVLGNLLAVRVIPYVGNLSDKIGRRASDNYRLACCLALLRLWAFSINSVTLAVILSQLMWDIAFQGYDAVYSSFFPELFQDARPGHGMTPESRDDGAALFPTLFASVAPPGSTKNPARGRGLPSAPQFLMRSRL